MMDRNNGFSYDNSIERGLPTTSALRQDANIMSNVQRRLVELGLEDPSGETESDGNRRKKGKKSGLSRTVEDTVVREIDWPHLYVYRGSDRRPTQFNELTIAEFVYGYIAMVENPRNDFNRLVMMQLLRDMMMDASLYSWPQVRNFYRIVGSGIEMARYDWTDSHEIQNIRLQYVQRPVTTTRPPHTNRVSSTSNMRVCFLYQQGNCGEQDSHDDLLHACAFCLRVTGTLYKHSERECRRKMYQPKN